ncbi:VirB4 family type IV secretion system protein [Clostridium sp. Cult3]|uniref:VirB4 family type IV secretion system protein n=1 Tax=Clostridium sp. Cult3 TaxID=2079004 RepID=UPI001F275E29|nr:hypothetical protein [Clostridium sp. Cult3]MCF6461533.1 hypothetical protein [Clostridium sp. Cult3]
MKTKETSTNNTLLNIIAPMGLEFRRNDLILGENKGRVYGIIKYPQDLKYGWLSRITNIPGTICSINFTPMDSGIFVENVARSISRNKGLANSTNDPLTRSRAEKAAEDGEKIMRSIDQQGEAIGQMGITIMPISTEDNLFEKACRKVESRVTAINCRLRNLSYLQEEGFKQLSPFYTIEEDIENITNRIVPLSTFVGGFPFASSGYNDGKGYYFAKDGSGGLVIVDPWKREEDRTNSNFVIMGVPGVGKSTAIKHIVLSEYMRGTKLIFIDPHREYWELCKSLNGDWINAGGGSKGKINPLQIRTSPKDEEEEIDKLYEDEGYGMGDMALYIKNLEIFFKLYIPSLSDRHIAILKSEIIELYNNFNIFWNTDVSLLSNEDFPIILDLYNQIAEKAKDKQNPYNKDYDDLSLYLKDLAIGSDSFLWNGYTTIESSSKCICLDTKDLQNSPDNIISTQYFNILQWAWEEIVKNPDERVLLIADEAYLMIDPKVPQSLVFLRNAAKGVRKYEGGIAVISHSVVDFLDPQIKMYGQALLDLATFKIIMGTDGQNLEETKNLYNLTDAEEDLIMSKKRGAALMIIGSKRLQIQFDIPEYKFKYMGTAGGR